jgi:pullulanase/glycogen debranching enzyme
MSTAEQVASGIKFIDNLQEGVIAYTINGAAVNDSWENILIAFNANNNRVPFLLPAGKFKWKSFPGENETLKDEPASSRVAGSPAQKILLPAYSCSIFYQSQ